MGVYKYSSLLWPIPEYLILSILLHGLKRFYWVIILNKFISTMRKSQRQDCLLCIRPLHVVIADYPAKKTIRIIHFFDINSWGNFKLISTGESE